MSEADTGTNEMGGDVATSSRGVRPRPIRKRGYHRALKRGETWAQMEKMSRDMMKTIAKMYLPIVEDVLFGRMAGLREFLK